jgi:protein-tyrosine phosphatase
MFPPRQVLERVWIGSIDTAQDEYFIRDNNIGLIVNCTRHVPSPFKDDIPTYRIPIDDSKDWQPLFLKHIRQVTRQMHLILTTTDKSILVHCHAGVSRSSSVVASYLILYQGFSPDNAIAYIQSMKPETFRPHPVFIDMLRTIHRSA